MSSEKFAKANSLTPVEVAVAPPRPPNSSFTRPLTADEIEYARKVFGESIDYSSVQITRGNLASSGASKALGNTIHLGEKTGVYRQKGRYDVFQTDSRDLTQTAGRELLIHELTHVWQYQNGDWGYAPASLIDQVDAFIETGDRNNAYEWEDALKESQPWDKWGIEQQAEAVGDYNAAKLRIDAGSIDPENRFVVSRLQPHIDKVRRGQGAFSIQENIDDLLKRVPNPVEVLEALLHSIPDPKSVLQDYIHEKLREFVNPLPIPKVQNNLHDQDIQGVAANDSPPVEPNYGQQQKREQPSEQELDAAMAQFGGIVEQLLQQHQGLASLPTGTLEVSPNIQSVDGILNGEAEPQSAESSQIDQEYRAMRQQQYQDHLANRAQTQQETGGDQIALG